MRFDSKLGSGLIVHLNVLHAAVVSLLEACPPEQRERVLLSFEAAMAALETSWDPVLFPEAERESGRIVADSIRSVLHPER